MGAPGARHEQVLGSERVAERDKTRWVEMDGETLERMRAAGGLPEVARGFERTVVMEDGRMWIERRYLATWRQP